MRLLATLITLAVAPQLTAGWNAASVWGIETNSTYHPNMTNVLFEGSLAALDVAHRATGAQGLYALDWTEPRAEMKTRGYCPSPIPRFHNTTACLTIHADVDVQWANTMAMLAPWRANGTVAGIFLGDEQCYHGVSLQNLTYMTKLIRRDWPEAVLYINEAQDLLMCNFNRLNETFFPDGACWPEELDWLGFDIYGFDQATTFDSPRNTYEWNLFDRMSTPHQYVIPTTVGHGGHDSSTESWSMEQYDAFCTGNAQSWFAYAETEPRVGGIFPWYWCMSAPARPCYYPEPKSVPRLNITYGFGLDQLPKCSAAFEAWGKKVRAHAPGGGRIIPHKPASVLAADGRRDGPLCVSGVTKTKPWRLDPISVGTKDKPGYCDTHH